MTKMFESLFLDLAQQLKTPEAQTFLQVHILRPIMTSVLSFLYPYLLGVMVLWVIMFICVALILLILVRGSLVGVLRVQ